MILNFHEIWHRYTVHHHHHHHHRVFCQRAGLSLQAQEPRLQFCQRQVFHRKLGNQGCSCFLHLTLSLSSAQTLKYLMWRWGEWFWLSGPFGLHRNSAQGLNISSIRVFDEIKHPEILITLRPYTIHIDFEKYQISLRYVYLFQNYRYM